jgi:UDP-N-acetylglucosamine diphosphorylase/glucosamine-1-phosphate N-acetyltransferase
MNLAIAILAAGKGKRMKNPELPKVLTQLDGQPLIHYVIETANSLNPVLIYVIIGYRKELVRSYIEQTFHNSNIVFVEQNEQLGTAHAILQIEPVLDKNIDSLLILSGDVPLIQTKTLKEFLEFHSSRKNALSLISTKVPNPKGYGRIIRNPQGEITAIVEDKDLTEELHSIDEINSGIYIFEISGLMDCLRQISNQNAQKEYYLTDSVRIYLENGKKVGAFRIENYKEVAGINTFEELHKLEHLLQTIADFKNS